MLSGGAIVSLVSKGPECDVLQLGVGCYVFTALGEAFAQISRHGTFALDSCARLMAFSGDVMRKDGFRVVFVITAATGTLSSTPCFDRSGALGTSHRRVQLQVEAGHSVKTAAA